MTADFNFKYEIFKFEVFAAETSGPAKADLPFGLDRRVFHIPAGLAALPPDHRSREGLPCEAAGARCI